MARNEDSDNFMNDTYRPSMGTSLSLGNGHATGQDRDMREAENVMRGTYLCAHVCVQERRMCERMMNDSFIN